MLYLQQLWRLLNSVSENRTLLYLFKKKKNQQTSCCSPSEAREFTAAGVLWHQGNRAPCQEARVATVLLSSVAASKHIHLTPMEPFTIRFCQII